MGLVSMVSMEKIPQNSTYKMVGEDLVLYADTAFDKNLIINGEIFCVDGSHSLTVYGEIKSKNISVHDLNADNINVHSINAHNINAHSINADRINANTIKAGHIDAFDISAEDIIAYDIDAEDIVAYTIICEKRIKKTPMSKTIAKILVVNRSYLEFKEQMPIAQTDSK